MSTIVSKKEDESKNEYMNLADCLNDYESWILEASIKTGFHGLDTIIDGWYPGEIYFACGDIEAGKTAFLLGGMRNLANDGIRSGLITDRDYAGRSFLKRLSNCFHSSTSESSNASKEGDVEAENYFPASNCYIYFAHNLSLEYIWANAKAMAEYSEVRCIFIDDFDGILTAERSMNGTSDVAKICNELRTIANELNVSLIIAYESEYDDPNSPTPHIDHYYHISRYAAYLLNIRDAKSLGYDENGNVVLEDTKIHINGDNNFGDFSLRYSQDEGYYFENITD